MLLTAVVAVLAAAGSALGIAVPSAAADPIDSCTADDGALVAVDFGNWGGGVVRGCDTTLTTGMDLLHDGGFTTAGTAHDGPAFICRIGNPAFDGGTQYPTPAEDACQVTPPASAYWSYWIAPQGQNTWTYSPLGAMSDQPEDGEVEAWVFGGTDIGGGDGQPDFTPNQVRDGSATLAAEPAPSATPAPRAKSAPAAKTGDAPAAPDLAAGVDYLTDPGRLLDGHYYEAFPDSGFADFGLTIDGAYALAATGEDDAALTKVVDWLDGLGKDGSGRTVNDWTGVGTPYAGGGSLGKLAVLAEVVDRDPHDFAGHDLIGALDEAVCPAKSTADTSCAAKGNYTYAPSVFSQALGVIAQLRADDESGAADAVAYLESLQNGDGSWPSLIPSSGDSDVDSTAMAAMALDLVGDAKADTAVDRALTWLAGRQLDDGGFPGAAGDSVNSAALALQGLSLDADSHHEATARARTFLAAMQNADGGFRVAKEGQATSDVRASTQALSGAVGTSFGTLTIESGGSGSDSPSPTPTISTPGQDGGSTSSATPSASGSVGPSADGGASGGGLTPNGAGSLAATGSDMLAVGCAAALLLAAGVTTVTVNRRRSALPGRHR